MRNPHNDPVHLENVNFGKMPVFHQIFTKSPSVSYEHYLHFAGKTIILYCGIVA
jgi:hypothetical protein